MSISKLLLAWISRNAEALAKFVGDLETHIADYLAKHDGVIAALQGDITDLHDAADAKINVIEQALDANIAKIDQAIAAKNKAAALLVAIKGAIAG